MDIREDNQHDVAPTRDSILDMENEGMERVATDTTDTIEEPKTGDDELREATVENKWDAVIGMYGRDREFHRIKISKSRGTALHVAVSDRREDVVKSLVEAIIKLEKESKGKVKPALELTNEDGDTPLHLAASRGFTSICKCIIGDNMEKRSYLITIDNKVGETPLFLAALSWQKQAFAYLSDLYKKSIQQEARERINKQSTGQGESIKQKSFEQHHSQKMSFKESKAESSEQSTEERLLTIEHQCYSRDLTRYDGDSILHCAIRRQFFDLTLIIMKEYPVLAESQNRQGFSPLKLLATRPSAFPSGIRLSWWKKMMYHCMAAADYDAKKALSSYLKETELRDPEPNVGKLAPQTYLICYNLYGILRRPLGIAAIRKIKQKHRWCNQLLQEFMKRPYETYLGSGGQPFEKDESSEEDEEEEDFISFWNKQGKDKENENGQKEEKEEKPVEMDEKETPLLAAARYGIVEMVDVLLHHIPSVIDEIDSEKNNVLLVAVKNKQPDVVEALRKRIVDKQVMRNLIKGVDNKENTMLHLAAKSSDMTWQITGVAMQMMWDIKWFRYIQSLVPDHYIFRSNKSEKTPGEIFNQSHEKLVSNSSDWLKDTSESCSVVAALIAGVSFATSSTVPGGNEDTGKPALEGQPAFDAFAISSLIGLFFSVTALIMFLSILTSRKQAKDFRRDLPLKLLLGLSSLFISIAAMFISFCAGHFFVLKDKYKQILFPIYAATCLPVTFYAIAQFPLYFDLLKAILKKVPQSRDKAANL